MSNDQYILAGNCLFVKGYSKNLLIDFQKNNWYHIDFDIPNKTDIDINELSDEIKKHLINEQMILKISTDLSGFFPQINLEFDTPAYIESVIIDRTKQSSYSLSKLVNWLDSLSTKLYQVRFFGEYRDSDIEEIILLTEKGICESIDLILPYEKDLDTRFIQRIRKYPKINSVTFYNCPLGIQLKTETNRLVYTKQNIGSSDCCGIVHPAFFVNTKQHILKSINYNSCLYKKLGIDTDGVIKNCPSMKESIGNLQNLNSVNIDSLETPQWFIKKDEIAVCQDCEFRYICTDCRVKVVDGENSRPSTCQYNPYTNKWKGDEEYSLPEDFKEKG